MTSRAFSTSSLLLLLLGCPTTLSVPEESGTEPVVTEAPPCSPDPPPQIGEQVQEVDDINDDLAVIIEELRREQDLPKTEPYVSPVQQVIDPLIESGQPVDPIVVRPMLTPVDPSPAENLEKVEQKE